MRTSRLDPKLRVVLAGLLVLVSLPYALRAPGTTDVDDWVNWMGRLRGEGVVRGYLTTILDYPPGTPLTLALTAVLSEAAGVSYRVGVKSNLLLTTLGFGVLYGLWRRSLLAGLGAGGALIFISVIHQYLDVWAGLPLLAAFWLLQREKFAAAGLLLGLATMMKWQPSIMAPAIGLSLLPGRPWRNVREISDSLPRVLAFLAGGVVPLAVAISVMGADQVLRSLLHGLRHPELNNQALNFPWLIQSAIFAVSPTDQQATSLCIAVVPWAKAVFYIAMLVAIAGSATLEGPRASRAARGALACYLVYFVFATGAPHENHLIQALVPALALLSIEGRRWLWPCSFLAVAASLNVALYYGFDGTKGLWYDSWPQLMNLAWVACPVVVCGCSYLAGRALAPADGDLAAPERVGAAPQAPTS